jgi:hypothetical protein
MDTPKHLYRYRAPSIQEITNLSDAKLWFSSPARFNDPFDCAYDISIDDVTRVDCAEVLERISQGRCTGATIAEMSDEQINEQSKQGLRTAIAGAIGKVKGVCCFSEKPNDILMWGHYSAGHSGFCLEFAVANEPMFDNVRRVKYSDELPRLGIETFTKEDFEQVLGLLLTKSSHWAYEKEWRVLHTQGDFLYGYNRTTLTGIYFGAKMPQQQVMMIASLLRETDTKFYQMKVSRSRFEIVAEPLPSITWIDYRKPA